jgi:hypothetical protein
MPGPVDVGHSGGAVVEEAVVVARRWKRGAGDRAK